MRLFTSNGHMWRSILSALSPIATPLQSKGRKVQVVATYPVDSTLAFVMGTAQEPGREIGINATVAGNIKVTFADDSEVTIPVVVGLTSFRWAVKKLTLAGVSGPATATGFNLL